VSAERILAQKDPSVLRQWLRKAGVAAELGEVLDEASGSRPSTA
jgi:hypothetical protein